jgi:upstream activation factor subunit UAF30
MDQTSINDLLKEIKALRKDMRKIRQHMEDPQGEKAKARAANNGFNKPLKLSDKLRAFLNLGPEDLMSRSQVTRKVNEYVEAKGLKNGQKIAMDATLQDLLQVPEGIQVTFLNIQKFINPHYIKEPKEVKPPKEPKAAPAPPAVAEATSEPPKEKKVRPKVAKPAAA